MGGYRMSKVAIDPQKKDKMEDLRDVLKNGTYAVEGTLNKVWYDGHTKVDVWGDARGPDDVPKEWCHVVCVKDGQVLDWEKDGTGKRHKDGGKNSMSVLWLGDNNTVDKEKGYFRKIAKVYRITPNPKKAHEEGGEHGGEENGCCNSPRKRQK